MAIQHPSSALRAPASSRPYPMAKPGYGKRSMPGQLPSRADDFALLPVRERYIAGFIDRLPDGASMDVKSLAKQLPLYGQQAVGSALRALATAGHLRRVRCLVGELGQVRWVSRTFWSRTARDNEWWAAIEVTPATAPVAARPSAPARVAAPTPAPATAPAAAPPTAPATAAAPAPAAAPVAAPTPAPAPVAASSPVAAAGPAPARTETPGLAPAPVEAPAETHDAPGAPEVLTALAPVPMEAATPPVRPGPSSSEPVAPPAPRALPQQRIPAEPSPAYLALARLGRVDSRLTLSAADCAVLEARAAEWFARGVDADYLTQALTAGLPPRVDSPVGFVRRRLTDKIPPHVPAVPSPPPPGAPVHRVMLECAKCGAPGRPEALPDGLCRPCRTSPEGTGAEDAATAPPGAPDVRALAAGLRDLLKSP
ncbi:MarR family transcriptional regulator [Streptomyces sp. NPDC002908]|uniref:MarR family transcriptional regulator n=1 Tax=Streptomyces sp. NPDC002908 TaxID=3364670 RepID=UPI00368D1072